MCSGRALPSEPLAQQHHPCPITSSNFLGVFYFRKLDIWNGNGGIGMKIGKSR
jgi:hypothetical protein